MRIRELRLLFLSCLLISGLWLLLWPSGAAEATAIEHWHVPAFYSTVQEAEGAIRNMQDKFVGWEGLPLQRIEIDRSGLRAFGVLDYTNTRQQWVYTGLGLTGGYYQPVVEPVHEEETTVVQLDKVKTMRLMQYPDLDKEYKWGVSMLVESPGGFDIKTFRTPTRAYAETLFNALLSLSVAAGAKLEMPRLGVKFETLTEKDLKTKPFKELGLKEPKGMKVTWISQGSPAAAGGLQEGDVIVEANDTPVENAEQFFRDLWGKFPSYNFKVLKKDGTVSRFVEPFPEEKVPRVPPTLTFASSTPAAGPATSQGPIKLGFSLRLPNNEELAAMKGKPGAVISSLAPGGVAEAAKLKVGDILLECNGKPVQGPEGLAPLLVRGENLFTVLRAGAVLQVKIAPEVSY
ncbi:MAG TPA: PDZ domain-containing protein [Synergistales bacterium]|nr:PDZ domain-containing protein [Synergistales bacterium]